MIMYLVSIVSSPTTSSTVAIVTGGCRDSRGFPWHAQSPHYHGTSANIARQSAGHWEECAYKQTNKQAASKRYSTWSRIQSARGIFRKDSHNTEITSKEDSTENFTFKFEHELLQVEFSIKQDFSLLVYNLDKHLHSYQNFPLRTQTMLYLQRRTSSWSVQEGAGSVPWFPAT